MAPESRRKSASVTQQLVSEPYRFDFFQAVRLLEHVAREQADAELGDSPRAVGGDDPLHDEVAHFHALASHRFSGSALNSISAEDGGEQTRSWPARMVVSFMGLTGPSGVLPRHYTRLIIERVRRKDRALAEFLDIFNHRAISLFYRAWEKYRIPLGFERASLDDASEEDLFRNYLHCCIGLGTGGIRDRQQIDDNCLLYYAGHFAHFPRNAASLESMTGDFFGLATSVVQFQGQWLYLDPADQSSLPGGRASGGFNNELGASVVIGRRVWSVENKFRIRLGPLDYAQFRRFTPAGDRLVPLSQFVRTYAGADYDFDVQPVLRADEVPMCQLGGESADPSYLGWNTWLISGAKEVDADDAVFVHDGFPIGS